MSDVGWMQAVEEAVVLASNGGVPPITTVTGGSQVPKLDEEPVDAMSLSPHGTLWQLRYLGPLEDEQVEIGPLLGRGGFGRVYKGGRLTQS